jgi:hypothetical protein
MVELVFTPVLKTVGAPCMATHPGSNPGTGMLLRSGPMGGRMVLTHKAEVRFLSPQPLILDRLTGKASGC